MNPEILSWIESTALGEFMRSYIWAMPIAETIHIMCLCILFGALLVIDLRVLGVAKFINMQIAMKFIPVALIGFSANLLTGIAFLCTDPFRYFPNIGFQWKMGLVLIAGLNALWFWFGEHKELSKLADGEDAAFQAKVIALISLVVWIAVIVLGRMMPYLEY